MFYDLFVFMSIIRTSDRNLNWFIYFIRIIYSSHFTTKYILITVYLFPGDSFKGTNDVPFSTKDQDNDSADLNCAVTYKGAWWYTKCHSSNLNGLYLRGSHESYADGVDWSTFRGHHYSLMNSVIKIRPKDFNKNSFEITPQWAFIFMRYALNSILHEDV